MRLDSIDKFKPVIGKAIFAIPTGNNATRKSGDAIYEFKVESLGRKYINLSRCESAQAYSPYSGATQSDINSGYGNNAGYLFFKTKDDAIGHYEKLRLAKVVASNARYFNFEKLSINQLTQISEILNQY